ncbi:MAG: hypothetical protein HN509_05985 [Halobacteriovoraceae bacterium]|jgi:hypothetical protein|nr:hypothetical protein [Halobacteriovoraceae bacterium]
MGLFNRFKDIMGKVVGSANKAKSTRAAALAQLRNDVADIEITLLRSKINTAFRLRRKFHNKYEILSWEEHQRDGFRLKYTLIDSFEKSGGVPTYEGPLIDVEGDVLIAIGPHINKFLEKFHEHLEAVADQAQEISQFKNHLNNIEKKVLVNNPTP